MKIPNHHLEALVRYFQAGDPALKVDGIYGPATARALYTYIDGQAKLTPQAPLVPSVDRMLAAFNSALQDVGQHEVPLGSNAGFYVESLQDETGLDRRGSGAWCAIFLSAHLMRSGIMVKSRGAPALIHALIALPGGRKVDAADLEPGRVYMALKRRGVDKHHIQLFKVSSFGALVQHVGGNEWHRVRSKVWNTEKFLEDALLLATYEDQ